MSAPIGNQYALGCTTNGRTRKIKSPKELFKLFSDYKKHAHTLTIGGFCSFLGMSRGILYHYKKRKGYIDVVNEIVKIINPTNNKRLFDYKLSYKYRAFERYRLDPQRKLRVCISANIRARLQSRDTKKETDTDKILKESLGYTFEDLKKHLESKFTKSMNWDNYGKVWQIDHIIPDSWFSYKTIEDDGFKQSWNLQNLQPLGRRENLAKSNKYTEKPQLELTFA